MKTQRILVCDAEPPNECVDSLMAAIEDGKDRLCSKNGADMEMCFRRGVGDARAAITTFKPDVITVPIDTRIVWENDDDIPHSIVEAPQITGTAWRARLGMVK